MFGLKRKKMSVFFMQIFIYFKDHYNGKIIYFMWLSYFWLSKEIW